MDNCALFFLIRLFKKFYRVTTVEQITGYARYHRREHCFHPIYRTTVCGKAQKGSVFAPRTYFYNLSWMSVLNMEKRHFYMFLPLHGISGKMVSLDAFKVTLNSSDERKSNCRFFLNVEHRFDILWLFYDNLFYVFTLVVSCSLTLLRRLCFHACLFFCQQDHTKSTVDI